jgi:galactose mutarotase-like enzyme
MAIILHNERLKAAIEPIGAELQELEDLNTGIQYMWSGDPAYWGKYSPVLFPIVGALKENTYFYQGHRYSLPRHGFARERVFELIDQTDVSASFLLVDDASTRENYPFGFQLVIRYTLLENLISCTYMVTNSVEEELLFSIGAHPAFAVPMRIPGVTTQYEDYYLQFNKSTELLRHQLDRGQIGHKTSVIQLEKGRLPLSPELFKNDAIVLKHIPDTEIQLRCVKHEHGLRFRFQDFPYFGIWAAPNAPFVCLEPWCGIADHIDHDQQLENKEGIIRLGNGEIFERAWHVTVF